MPLEELSNNLRAKGSQSQVSIHGSGKIQAQRVKPDVVSSMLKTSTEIGNIESISARPTRLPRSTSHLSKHGRSDWPYVAASTSRAKPQSPIPGLNSLLPRSATSFPALSRQDIARSSLSSYHSNPRLRRRPPTQSPHHWIRRAAQSHIQGTRDLRLYDERQIRSRSPAASDVRSMPAYRGRPSIHRASSTATWVSSPSPAFDLDSNGYYRAPSKSTISSYRLPSPTVSGSFPGPRRSPNSSNSGDSLSKPHQIPAYLHPNRPPANRPTAPLYYDYTEAFADEYYQNSDREMTYSLQPDIRHFELNKKPESSYQQPQSGFDMAQEPVFKSGRMLVQHDHAHSEQLQQSSVSSCNAQDLELHSPRNPNDLNGSTEKRETSQDHICSGTPQPTSTTFPAAEGEPGSARDLALVMDPGVRRSFGRLHQTSHVSPSTFFPNVNRSSRDLTGLAAKVHDAAPNNTLVKNIKAEGENHRRNEDLDPHVSPKTDERVLKLESRSPAIVCPTPKRGISCQSSQNFSKILGFDDQGCATDHGLLGLTRSRSEINRSDLERAMTGAERNLQVQYPIRPFAHQYKSRGGPRGNNKCIVESADQDQWSGEEKSTVELLLDSHIECLGLEVERKGESVKSLGRLDNDSAHKSRLSSSGETNVFRTSSELAAECMLQSSELDLVRLSSTVSPISHELIPRNLLSPGRMRRPRLKSSRSIPCMSSPLLLTASNRLPVERNSFPSVLNSLSTGAALGRLISDNVLAKLSTPKVRIRQPSAPLPSSRSVSCSSGHCADILGRYHQKLDEEKDGDVVRIPHSRYSIALHEQPLQPRGMGKKFSYSRCSKDEGDAAPSERSSTCESFCTATVGAQNRTIQRSASEQDVTMTARSRKRLASDTQKPQFPDTNRLGPALRVQSRASSSIANRAPIVGLDDGMSDNLSAQIISSHDSEAGIIEAFENPELSASMPHLATPDLGPPLSSINLNGSFPLPSISIRATPNLTPMQSFFSDDSSAGQPAHASTQKRLRWPGLGHISHSSASVRPMIPGTRNPNGVLPSKLHRSWRRRREKTEQEENDDVANAVAISECTEYRRRVAKRFKKWWRKTCIQRTLRPKSTPAE